LIQENKIYGILLAPPCTMFSIARNDTTAKKPRDLREGMKLVLAGLKIVWECRYQSIRKQDNRLKFWALENPKGYLRDFLGKPVFEFEPFDFGDPYTKKTQLWGNFNKPKKNPVNPRQGTMVKYASDFKEIEVDEEYRKKLGIDARTIRRSITPSGFAKAFYEVNK